MLHRISDRMAEALNLPPYEVPGARSPRSLHTSARKRRLDQLQHLGKHTIAIWASDPEGLDARVASKAHVGQRLLALHVLKRAALDFSAGLISAKVTPQRVSLEVFWWAWGHPLPVPVLHPDAEEGGISALLRRLKSDMLRGGCLDVRRWRSPKTDPLEHIGYTEARLFTPRDPALPYYPFGWWPEQEALHSTMRFEDWCDCADMDPGTMRMALYCAPPEGR